jgi:hypothetical protein
MDGCSPGYGGSSRTTDGAPTRSRDGWGSAAAAAEAADELTGSRRRRREEGETPPHDYFLFFFLNKNNRFWLHFIAHDLFDHHSTRVFTLDWTTQLFSYLMNN